MTPWDYASKSNTEHAHQTALIMWAKMASAYGLVAASDPRSYENKAYAQAMSVHSKPLPLNWLFAIPNGGERDFRVAANLRAEGVKSGVADLLLPVSAPKRFDIPTSCRWNGLFIEMKKPTRRNHRDGGLSPEQQQFRDDMLANNYAYVSCYTWLEAVEAITLYLGLDNGRKGLSEIQKV